MSLNLAKFKTKLPLMTKLTASNIGGAFSFVLFWGLIETAWLLIINEMDGFAMALITLFYLPLLAFWSASWFVFIRFAKFRRMGQP